MVDTANVLSQMKLNANLNLKDFNSIVEQSGSLPIERIVEILRTKIVQEGTMPPRLPASLEIVRRSLIC